MKKLFKQNTTLLLLAGAAILTIIVLLVVLFTGSTQQDQSRLADEQTESSGQANGVDGQEFAQGEDAQVFQQFQDDDTYSECIVEGGQCYNFSAAGLGSCIDARGQGSQQSGASCPNTGETCCMPPSEQQVLCGDLGGVCSSQNTECSGKYFDTSDCSFDAGQACCIPLDPSDDPNQQDPPPQNPALGDDDGDNVGGNPPTSGGSLPANDPRNFCSSRVDCGPCDQTCAYGPGTCQTCTSADNSCSFKQACSDDPQDPIFENTCGGGDFLDASKQQRSFDESQFGDRYNHVICPGFSTCEGGPNTDGLYWCIDVVDDPSAPGGGTDAPKCTKLNSPREVEASVCDSRCGTPRKCDDGSESIVCLHHSQCTINQPHNPSDPQDPGADPTDPSNFPEVTSLNPSINKGSTTSSKITLTITGKADKYNVYIHRGNPSPGDQVVPSYNPSNVPTTQFALIGTTSTGKITFDSPTTVGTYKIAVNAMYNKSGSNPEVVCSWHKDVYTRNTDGSLTPISGECKNINPINFTVEPNTTTDSSGWNSSTSTSGLVVYARTGPNCGGSTEVYWSQGTGDGANGWYLYRGNSADFTPSASNWVQKHKFGSPRTQQNPYDDWSLTPGTRYYYKVIKSNSSGNINSTSAFADASPACN